MKKLLSLILALLTVSSVITMTACGGETEDPTDAPTEVPEVIPETPYPTDCLRISGIDVSEYVIVSDTSLGGRMELAATELQEYIETTCGAKLEISTTPVPAGTKRILLDGATPTNNDEFRVYNDEDGLVISGTSNIGIIQAVYHFLEKFLDWRFFSAECETCYEHDLIDLSGVDYTYVHPYAARGLYVYDTRQAENRADFKLKRYQSGPSRDPNGIHTFESLAGGDGDNGSGGDQPCLNDPTVRENMRNNIRAFLDSHPDAVAVHVSQNDNQRYCTCEKCQADIDYYGAPSGSIIEICNYICEDLETYKDGAYKDVLVVTFAYQYSLDAPDNIVCHDNVMIEYAIIDLCHQHSLTDACCKLEGQPYVRENQGVMAEMKKWAEICKHFYIWDYGHALKYYYCVTPNFDTLFDNYKYYNSIGAWGYVFLCNNQTNSAEFGEMRNYLVAKLTEEPDMTKEEYYQHMDEFGDAFYGAAWPLMKKYLEFCDNMSNEKNSCYGVFSSPEVIYGDHAFGPHGEYLTQLFDRAELLVADDEMALLHVRRLRISMDYLRIGAIWREEYYTSKDPDRKAAITAQVQAFWEECYELELTWPHESYQIPANLRYTQNPRSVLWVHDYRD